ncbi:DUF6588 family protein [Mariniflexile gromovii]|uniref:Outer membrane protein with beta-barrel domain n=1 Tax=Mariniflexile gromovii TaxID=362523 RepID=A0ABS4BV05_9FLAO|nr:DUF6588 family protein [Mariniflexile gromovii]MBP0904401.1 hypothetical protein [Mariniflexile gromovii]
MKKFSLLMLFCLATISSNAQDIDALLTAGVKNAERFANDYLAPGTNGLMYSMNANWFNTADAKPLGGFEISIIANAASIKDEHKTFLMNIADYNSDPEQDFTVEFADGAASKKVASALGENDPDINILVRYEDPILGEQEETITLPSGIGSQTANLLPTAFIQGALGLSKGIELKARFVPKIDTDEIDFSMYGAGLQVEFTKWLPADKILPVAVSGLVAYTHLDGSYDLTDSSGINGDNQRLENDTNTWLFQLIASTKLPVINFYGGIGYIKGKSESNLLGTYIVSDGPFFSQTIEDPFSVSSEVASVRGTIGTKLKLGFFRLNAEYHLSEFDAFSVGLNFGFR